MIFTDHKPLTFAFSKVSDAWCARQQRELSAISELTTDVRHVAGKANLVADTLFRASLSAVVSSPHDLHFVAMTKAQCEFLKFLACLACNISSIEVLRNWTCRQLEQSTILKRLICSFHDKQESIISRLWGGGGRLSN